MRRSGVGLALVTATAAAVVLHVAPSAQQPVFRADVNATPLYVAVRDRDDNAVMGLTAADFDVRVDGRPAGIVSFSNEPQPFAAVILVDFSASMSTHRAAVREATTAFIDRLLPGDRVRLGGFSNRIVLAPDTFTGERDALLDALKFQVGRVDAGGSSPVWRAATESLDALRAQPLRRVLIMLSDGHDTPGRGQGGATAEEVIRQARADEALVHALGFVIRRWGSTAYDPVRIHGPNPRLETLARRSGGRYIEIDRSPDFTGIFTRLIDELHSQYLVGVSVEDRDGRRHDLDVRVRRDGMRVRAPDSFVAQR